jgi:hypothetical protein
MVFPLKTVEQKSPTLKSWGFFYFGAAPFLLRSKNIFCTVV